MPKVSIVIPIYNADRFLNQCLCSIQHQTFSDWECILVDDGSTDISSIICDNFERNDKRFRVIHQPNRGVSYARNAGIERTCGEFLSFVDPDDYIEADYLELLLDKQHGFDADVVFSAVECFLDKSGNAYVSAFNQFASEIMGKVVFNHGIPPLESKHGIAAYLSSMGTSSWGKLFKSWIWNDVRFPEGVSLGEDVFTVLDAVCNAERLCTEAGAVYHYRVRKTGLSHRRISPKEYNLIVSSWAESCNSIIEKIPEVKETVSSLYSSGLYYYRRRVDWKKWLVIPPFFS